MGPAMPDSARLLLAFSDWVKNWGWTLILPPPLLWYLCFPFQW
jgi:type II secretory pathway component PulF